MQLDKDIRGLIGSDTRTTPVGQVSHTMHTDNVCILYLVRRKETRQQLEAGSRSFALGRAPLPWMSIQIRSPVHHEPPICRPSDRPRPTATLAPSRCCRAVLSTHLPTTHVAACCSQPSIISNTCLWQSDIEDPLRANQQNGRKTREKVKKTFVSPS